MKKDWGSRRGWVALGRKEGNGDSKTHLAEIWRKPLCLTGSRLMTIKGIWG